MPKLKDVYYLFISVISCDISIRPLYVPSSSLIVKFLIWINLSLKLIQNSAVSWAPTLNSFSILNTWSTLLGGWQNLTSLPMIPALLGKTLSFPLF